MEFEKLTTDPTDSALDGIVDVYIARDYDPFSPAQPDPRFAETMRAAMDGSESFRNWVGLLGLERWAAQESE